MMENTRELEWLESRLQESQERIETLEMESQNHLRQRREAETQYEREKEHSYAMSQGYEAREQELLASRDRLKSEVRDSLEREAIRKMDEENSNLTPPPDRPNFGHSSGSSNRSSPTTSPRRAVQDNIIKNLRLELADAQIKLIEAQHGDSRVVQKLEAQLSEARVLNAKLLEENNSYQILLQERTVSGEVLRGDFMRRNTDRSPSGSQSFRSRRDFTGSSMASAPNLADELSAVQEDESEETVIIKKLEVEVASLKEQNKASTLYINKIIERLLQHQGFESILHKADDGEPSSLSPPYAASASAPAPKDEEAGFLRRATTIIRGTRSRPVSQAFSASADLGPADPALSSVSPGPRGFEDPATAPSVAIGRSRTVIHSGHRRNRTDAPWARSLVDTMYRPPEGATFGRSPTTLLSPTPRAANFGYFTAQGCPQPMSASAVDSASGSAAGVASAAVDSRRVVSPARQRGRTATPQPLGGSSPDSQTRASSGSGSRSHHSRSSRASNSRLAGVDTPQTSNHSPSASLGSGMGYGQQARFEGGSKMRTLRLVEEKDLAREQTGLGKLPGVQAGRRGGATAAGNRASWLPGGFEGWSWKGA